MTRTSPSSPATGEDDKRQPHGSLIVEQGTKGYTLGAEAALVSGGSGLDTRDTVLLRRLGADSRCGEPGGGLGQFLSALEVGRISSRTIPSAPPRRMRRPWHARQHEAFGPRSTASRRSSSSWPTGTEIEAARWLTYYAAATARRGKPFKKEAAMAQRRPA